MPTQKTMPMPTQKKVKNSFELFTFCDSRGIQTHNLLIRSQMLYSVELGSLISFKRVQRYALFVEPPNISATFLEKSAKKARILLRKAIYFP